MRIKGKFLTYGWLQLTESEGISGETFRTIAHGDVINHSADRARTTGTGARISALHVDAGHVALALGIDRAFRSAIRWLTSVAFYAATRSRTANVSTLSETTARGWHARVFLHWTGYHNS